MSSSPGVDLLEIDRLERALDRWPRLAERLFTSSELAYAAQHARPARQLSARFCAKEATIKALSLREPVWRDLEVEVLPSGKPAMRLHGEAARVAANQGVEVSISLTHGRDLAAAVALAT